MATTTEEPSSGGGTTETTDGGGTASGSVTLYSSLPLQGASRPQSEDVIKGIELALKEHGDGKLGNLTVEYKSLDDATASAGQWDAAQTKANAREVAQDDSAIAYIGEFNSGASANSIPTLNEANILQVSPSNTALGLTKGGDGAEPGEPDKYYPAQTRTYGRVVPIDTIQGAAQAQYMANEGVTKVYILDDNEVYGKGVAANTRPRSRRTPTSRSSAPTRGTARPRTTARWPTRSPRRAPMASSPAASSTTTLRSSTRTSTRHCPTPSCSARTASRRWTSPRRSPKRFRPSRS